MVDPRYIGHCNNGVHAFYHKNADSQQVGQRRGAAVFVFAGCGLGLTSLCATYWHPLTALPHTQEEITKLLKIAPKYGIEILLPYP